MFQYELNISDRFRSYVLKSALGTLACSACEPKKFVGKLGEDGQASAAR